MNETVHLPEDFFLFDQAGAPVREIDTGQDARLAVESYENFGATRKEIRDGRVTFPTASSQHQHVGFSIIPDGELKLIHHPAADLGLRQGKPFFIGVRRRLTRWCPCAGSHGVVSAPCARQISCSDGGMSRVVIHPLLRKPLLFPGLTETTIFIILPPNGRGASR